MIGTTAALILGGTALAGAGISALGASSAARAQTAGADRAADVELQMFNQSRADSEPWRLEGGRAITSLGQMLRPGYDHTTSPGYEFRRSEGIRGMENSAASRGILQSGGTLKGIGRYADGLAASDFTDQFNRTASVAAGGQQTNATIGALGAQAAGNIGNAVMGGANARASGYMGVANAFSQGLGNIGQIAAYRWPRG